MAATLTGAQLVHAASPNGGPATYTVDPGATVALMACSFVASPGVVPFNAYPTVLVAAKSGQTIAAVFQQPSLNGLGNFPAVLATFGVLGPSSTDQGGFTSTPLPFVWQRLPLLTLTEGCTVTMQIQDEAGTVAQASAWAISLPCVLIGPA